MRAAFGLFMGLLVCLAMYLDDSRSNLLIILLPHLEGMYNSCMISQVKYWLMLSYVVLPVYAKHRSQTQSPWLGRYRQFCYRHPAIDRGLRQLPSRRYRLTSISRAEKSRQGGLRIETSSARPFSCSVRSLVCTRRPSVDGLYNHFLYVTRETIDQQSGYSRFQSTGPARIWCSLESRPFLRHLGTKPSGP